MRTRVTAIAGVMAIVIAASACAPPVISIATTPFVATPQPRARRLSVGAKVGLGVAMLGGMALIGGLGAAAMEDVRYGPNLGAPRESDARAELSVAAVGAAVMVLGFLAAAVAGRERDAPAPARP